MDPAEKLPRPERVEIWLSRERWRQRIISFNASWFTVSMSTGIVTQVLHNFPYPARWLDTLGYCFWVLSMLLFVFFSTLSLLRLILFPKLSRAIFQDFYQTSYLGAIPITLDTILVSITIFYNNRYEAILAAYILFWISAALCVIIGGIVPFIVCAYQEPPELRSVTGVWLISVIPFIVHSSAGAALVQYVSAENQKIVLVVSFLMWSAGMALSTLIVCIYFWRLVSCKLPAREAIVSCFIPVGPYGMGAYSIEKLAVGLANYIQQNHVVLVGHASSPALVPGVSESIYWLGIISALFLVAFASFWLVGAIFSVSAVVPKRFNVGFWAFVFPMGVYSNGLSQLAKDLDNSGFRGWGATTSTATVLLWLGCALMTLWKGVWCGELFFAPGLEGWNEKKALKSDAPDSDVADSQPAENVEFAGDCEILDGQLLLRLSRPDGTYHVDRRRRRDVES